MRSCPDSPTGPFSRSPISHRLHGSPDTLPTTYKTTHRASSTVCFAIRIRSINYTSALSSLYFVAFGTAFAIRSSPFKKVFDLLFRFTRPLNLKVKNNSFSDYGVLCQFVLLYIILMVASGVGLLWITNSREAYQLHRVSVGVLWSLCQATL